MRPLARSVAVDRGPLWQAGVPCGGFSSLAAGTSQAAPYARLYLAMVSLGFGDLQENWRILEGLATEQAENFYAQGRFVEAHRLYRELLDGGDIKTQYDDAKFLPNLAVAARQLGDIEGERRARARLAAVNPNHPLLRDRHDAPLRQLSSRLAGG